MTGHCLYRWMAFAAFGLASAGCSCSDQAPHDAGGGADGASLLDGAPSDGRNPFVPTDGGPLTHEPCAAGFEVRLIEWPRDVPVPNGSVVELRLTGRRNELAALWRVCPEGEVDCSERVEQEMAWASFSAATGALTGSGVVRVGAAYQPAFPSGLGWTEDAWRVYFRVFGASVRLGWLDVSEGGPPSAPTLVGPPLSSTNTSEVVGSSLAERVSVGDSDPPAVQYLTVRDGVARVHTLEDPSVRYSGSPVLSRNQRWVAFAGPTDDHSPVMAVGRLDLDTEELVVRELPADVVAREGLPGVASVDDAGRVIVATRVYRTPSELSWRVRYVWLDEELRVRGSWTSSREWRYPGNFQAAPVVGVGEADLFVFTVDRALYAGVSLAPGSIEGAARPLAFLGSSDIDAGTPGWETWAYGSVAYAAIAFRSEVTLVALRCAM